jgi:hypothetical protein
MAIAAEVKAFVQLARTKTVLGSTGNFFSRSLYPNPCHREYEVYGVVRDSIGDSIANV